MAIGRRRGPEPSAELELAFLLAGTAAQRRDASARILELARRSDPRTLAAALERRRLLPLLGRRLISATGGDLPEELVAAVAAAHARDRAIALRLEAATSQVSRALAAAGIHALALKGTALAEEAHGDIGLRASDDVDLLVEAEKVHAGVHALRGLGFQAPKDAVDATGLPLLHFALRHPQLPAVELHWRVHWHERRFAADMVRRARPLRAGQLRPDPVDTAAALLLFFARDGFYGLRLAADIAGWWDRHGAGLAPGILDAHASRYPQLRRTWQAAALAAERYAGVPLAFWFTPPLASDRRRDLALRLGNWSQLGDRDQLAANIVLVDGLLSPAGSLRPFLGRVLAAAPGARSTHFVKTVSRFVPAFWAIRKGRWVSLPPRPPSPPPTTSQPPCSDRSRLAEQLPGRAAHPERLLRPERRSSAVPAPETPQGRAGADQG